MRRPPIDLAATVLSTPDPRSLATFYEELLGWGRVTDREDWVVLVAPDDVRRLSFHVEDAYEAPTWPSVPGAQLAQSHLDVGVADLDVGVRWATAVGARLASHQPQEDVRVMIDPDGHPFCLFASPRLAAAAAGSDA